MQIRVFIQTLTGLMSGLLSAGEIFVGIKSPGKDVSRGESWADGGPGPHLTLTLTPLTTNETRQAGQE